MKHNKIPHSGKETRDFFIMNYALCILNYESITLPDTYFL